MLGVMWEECGEAAAGGGEGGGGGMLGKNRFVKTWGAAAM